ncbi:MAG: hypothetical protein PHC50_06960 [Candidatus Cloacimonetes bacterium]|nr:hypothetical protein [Candidatus Cloacimonadota bacterium]
MRLDKRRLILLLFMLFIAGISLVIAEKQEDGSKNLIKHFQVTDNPADDGTGLILSWEPLDRSKRIIEYRVYRGVNPDTLFFLDYIQVNPKSGVAADRMYYYDSSPSEISDISHPRKLKLEKGQPKDGILYGKPPRDFVFSAKYLEHFNMLSSAKRKDFYFKSNEVVADSLNGDSYAGLKSNQQTVLYSLKPGKNYYYSVVAVDERRQMLQHTEVLSGVPEPNSPEAAVAFYSVILTDIEELRFEWELPMNKSYLAQYHLWQFPDLAEDAWEALKAEPEQAMAAGKMLGAGAVGSGQLPNYTKLPIPGAAESLQNAAFAIQLVDYEGRTSFSGLSRPRVLTSAALPSQPSHRIEDKPNDKGDRLSVIWDDPIVFVIKTTSLNRTNTRFKINYQVNKNDNQTVKKIWFEFSNLANGKNYGKTKEFFLDNSITLSLPKDFDIKDGLKVKITLEGEPKIPEEYVIEQDLVYNDAMLALLPDKALYRNGTDVSGIYNVVYRKLMQSPLWRLVMRNTSFDNSLDVTIPYPSTVVKQVKGIAYAEGDSLIIVDSEGVRSSRKLLPGESRAPRTLLDPVIDFHWDSVSETPIRTNLYAGKAQKMYNEALEGLNSSLAELQAEAEALEPDSDEAEALDERIKKLEAQIAAYNSDIVLNSFKAKSNRQRIKQVLKAFDNYSRSQTFMVVKTDSKGLFVESFPPENEHGKYEYIKPISDWFDTNKIVTLIATILFCIIVVVFVFLAKRGKDLYIRPIAGLQEIDNAVGRATEMGRPMLYCMGHGSLSDVATIASMGILSQVARKAAEYDTKLIVPCYDYIVLPIAQEIVREAHYAVGRPDSYDRNNVFYLTNVQFAYVAGVNGIMVREKVATNFFMGYFSAEALLMTETGNAVGAVQIAGTDAVTQIPFFITTCQYTLIGEELYAASAYLNRDPMILGNLKAQDYFKFIIISVVLLGAILASFEITGLTLLLPEK